MKQLYLTPEVADCLQAGIDYTKPSPHSWDIPDKNCLSYWYPQLQAAGLPTPATEIVRWPGETWALANLTDGKPVDGFDEFCEQIAAAGDRLGPAWPKFLRTGMTSGKHRWRDCCCLPSKAAIPQHVYNLVEWSHLIDMCGLYHDVFVVREMLPVDPVCVLPAYRDFPLVQEVRAFVKGGAVICQHAYWPTGAVKEGFPRTGGWGEEKTRDLPANIDELVRRVQDECFHEAIQPLLQTIAEAFKDDGAWSVDILTDRHGQLWVTDMAVASQSYHWEGCERKAEF